MQVKIYLSKIFFVEVKFMEFYCMFGKYIIYYIVIVNLLFFLVKILVNNGYDNYIFLEDVNRNIVQQVVEYKVVLVNIYIVVNELFIYYRVWCKFNI